jgi:hypothetical protein
MIVNNKFYKVIKPKGMKWAGCEARMGEIRDVFIHSFTGAYSPGWTFGLIFGVS